MLRAMQRMGIDNPHDNPHKHKHPPYSHSSAAATAAAAAVATTNTTHAEDVDVVDAATDAAAAVDVVATTADQWAAVLRQVALPILSFPRFDSIRSNPLIHILTQIRYYSDILTQIG